MSAASRIGWRGALPGALVLVVLGCTRNESPHAAPGAREKELVERLRHDPMDLEARLALANLYYDTDRPHRAIPAYLEVLKQRPDDPGIRTDLGTCYKRINMLGKARAEFERVLRDHPAHLQATFNLAIVSELMKAWTRAAELWDKVAAMVPETREGKVAVRYAARARAAAKKAAKEKAGGARKPGAAPPAGPRKPTSPAKG